MNIFLDIECYKNYFLVLCMREDGKLAKLLRFNDHYQVNQPLIDLITHPRTVLITFNGQNYDIPMLERFLSDCNNEQLKATSDEIIRGLKPWQLSLDVDHDYKLNYIDLLPVCPGQSGLKMYGARLGAHKIQELPIDPNATITPAQAALLEQYCANDLRLTKLIYDKIKPQIDLRQEMTKTYGIDLRSKSDAQIAEAIIKKRLEQRDISARKPTAEIKPFKIPLKCESIDISDVTFTISDTGSIKLPKELESKKIRIGNMIYKLGIGGLHSTESSRCIVTTKQDFLIDYDVTSYYPSIILNKKLFPAHLTDEFLNVYRDIYTERLEAKKSKNVTVAETLKIVLNGSFGKFGSKYSILYAPELLATVTLTGQISLLMLIERLEDSGVSVVSANTDGIVVWFRDKYQLARSKRILDGWQQDTGFALESTQYRMLASQSVNNYLAIKPDNTTKGKGVFAPPAMNKNPFAPIVPKAVANYLARGVPIYQTVFDSQDIKDFLTVRKVTGGALYGKKELGSIIRWVKSISANGYISYAKNGNKVPNTDGCYPIDELPDFVPGHVHRIAYVCDAYDLLRTCGFDIKEKDHA